MLIPKSLKLDLVCSTDPTRYGGAMQAINVTEIAEGVATCVATDGRMLAVVKVGTNEGDAVGLIPFAAWAEARKGRETLTAAGSIKVPNKKGAVSEFQRPEGEFPRYKSIVVENEGGVTVAFNAEYLWRLAQAIGTDSDGLYVVTLKLAKDNPANAPLRIESTNGNFGLLMSVTVAK
jgi:hypothetical protein